MTIIYTSTYKLLTQSSAAYGDSLKLRTNASLGDATNLGEAGLTLVITGDSGLLLHEKSVRGKMGINIIDTVKQVNFAGNLISLISQ